MKAGDDLHSSALERLLEIEGELKYMAIQILSASLPGTLHNLFANSAVYSAKQSCRIRIAYGADPLGEIDAIAWSTRSLLETRLMLHHIMRKEHDQAMATINEELTRDDHEISLGLLFSGDHEAAKSELQALIKALPKTPNNSKMADQSDFTIEYRTYYTLLCKYTHSSMYLLFGSPSHVRKIEIADVMIEGAVRYMEEICEATAYTVNCLPGP